MHVGVYVRTQEVRAKLKELRKTTEYKSRHSQIMKKVMSDKSVRDKSSKKMAGENNHQWKGGLIQDLKYLTWLKNKRNRLKKAAFGSHSYQEWHELKAKSTFICLC